MANKMVTIEIPEDLSNYVESLMFETNARRDIISTLIRQGVTDDNAQFKRYHDEYVEFFTKYETAKTEITNTFVKPKYPNASWNLDFATNTLHVVVTEEAK